MDFFIKESNVRPGNRGGRSYFKWDDVRLMDNKNRESYLGVSQCIGFLDKGGKWRKRDWWQTFNPDEKKVTKSELSKIKDDEQDKLYEAVYGKKKIKNENPNKKLTDFQWEKLTKKEGKKGLNDFDYYYDDKHRAGLGVNTTMSFRANPYNNNENLGRLDGNLNENVIQNNTLAWMIEKYEGAFPTWLCPEQVRVLPISEKFMDYANAVNAELVKAGVRSTVDERSEKIGYKLRDLRLQRIPYALIVGQKETDEGVVSVWNRKAGDKGAAKLADFIAEIRKDIDTKALSPEG